MQSKYIKPFILFIPALILQMVAVPLISIEGVAPHLITILLVYSVLSTGQFYGTALGFSFGLVFDLVSGGVLGSAMFSKTLAAFIAGYFYNENKIEYNTKTYLFPLIVALIATVESVIYTSLSSSTQKSFFLLLFLSGLLPGLYTAVLSFPLVIFRKKSELE